MAGDTSHVVYIRFQGEDDGMKEVAVDAKDAINTINITIGKTGEASDKAKEKSDSFLMSMLKFAAVKVVFASVAWGLSSINTLIKESMQGAADWEDKVNALGAAASNLSEDQVAEFANEIQRMSEAIPVGAAELMDIAEVAARMKFPEDELEAFTKEIGLGTKMFPEWSGGAQGLAQDVADLNRKWGEGTESTRGFLSMLDALSDQTNVSAQAIAQFLDKFTMAPQFGLARDEAAALGSTLMQLGVEGGGAATILNQLGATVQQGGEKLEDMAAAAGLSVEEFERIAKESPYDALLSLARGLSSATKEGRGAAIQFREVARSEADVKEATSEYQSAVDDAQRALDAMNAALAKADDLMERYGETLNDAEKAQRAAGQAWDDANSAFSDMPQAWEEYQSQLAALWEGIDNFTRAFSTDSGTRAEILKRESEEAKLWAEYQDKVNEAYQRKDDLTERAIELGDQAEKQQRNAQETLEDYYEQLAIADEEEARHIRLTSLAADLLSELGPQYEAVSGDIEGASDSTSALNEAMVLFGGESARALLLLADNQALLAENTEAAALATLDQSDYMEEMSGILGSTNAINQQMNNTMANMGVNLATILTDVLMPFRQEWLSLTTTFGEITRALPPMMGEWAKGNPTIQTLRDSFREFSLDMEDVKADIKDKDWELAWKDFTDAWRQAWDDIAPIVKEAWEESIKPKIEDMLKEIIALFSKAAGEAWDNFFSETKLAKGFAAWKRAAEAAFEWDYWFNSDEFWEEEWQGNGSGGGSGDNTNMPPGDYEWGGDTGHGAHDDRSDGSRDGHAKSRSSSRSFDVQSQRRWVDFDPRPRVAQEHLHFHGLLIDGPSVDRAAGMLLPRIERKLAHR